MKIWNIIRINSVYLKGICVVVIIANPLDSCIGQIIKYIFEMIK